MFRSAHRLFANGHQEWNKRRIDSRELNGIFIASSMKGICHKGGLIMKKAKIITSSLIIFVIFFSNRCSQEKNSPIIGIQALSGLYMGQIASGTGPGLFLPGLITTEDSDRCIAFLENGTLCVFLSAKKGVLHTREIDGRWTRPEKVPWQDELELADFTGGPDGQTIYFQSRRFTGPEDTVKETNIWSVKWTGSEWEKPSPLPAPVNTEKYTEAYPTVSSDGTVYFFCSNRPDSQQADIYRCRYRNGIYLDAERLPWPINTEFDEHDPFVAPDESWLMFGSRRPGVLGRDDTHICFRRKDGSWTHPLNLGSPLNSWSSENCIIVTPDDKYFFFSSGRVTEIPKGEEVHTPYSDRYGDNDFYWSDTAFIRELGEMLLDKSCAAEAIKKEYREKDLQASIDKLKDLYTNEQSRYYFSIYELLTICEDLMKKGEREESDRFYQALFETLSNEHHFRIKLGYAKFLTMNGLVTEGLTLLAELAPDYPAVEYDVNLFVLGRDLLSRSRLEDSIKVLKENVSKFPDSFYAHFYLAEAYRQHGDIALAKEHCLETLDLYPDHGGATEILKSLNE